MSETSKDNAGSAPTAKQTTDPRKSEVKSLGSTRVYNKHRYRGKYPLPHNEQYPFSKTRLQPVLSEALAAAGEIEVIKKDLNRQLYGMCFSNQERTVIILNTKCKSAKQNFTFAHELAHASQSIFCGRGYNWDDIDTLDFDSKSYKAKERLCNKIAAEILMPADLVLLEVFQAGRVNSYALASRFNVSLTSMRARLRNLGLL